MLFCNINKAMVVTTKMYHQMTKESETSEFEKLDIQAKKILVQ
jgi:hypothetical protein